MERTEIDARGKYPLQTSSHGWDMSLSEEAATNCGISPRTGANAHPLSV